MTDKGKTAMARRGPSRPLRNLIAKGCIQPGQRVLDYGCGRGADVAHLNAIGCHTTGFDPYHGPTEKPVGLFDVVLCTYVLNVLTEAEITVVLYDISRHLSAEGRVYVTVRRDIPNQGTTTQGWVTKLYSEAVIQQTRYDTYIFCRNTLPLYSMRTTLKGE
jgi:ubiquinone/menaquinone biosynthesis C-methylase UbiE